MGFLDQKYYRREPRTKRIYDIEIDMYMELSELSEVYEASVTELVNAAIEFLVKTENVTIFGKNENRPPSRHSLMIRNSNIAGLDRLKDKYGISINRLVNIAIRNLLEDSKNSLNGSE